MSDAEWTLEAVSSLGDISAADWDACAFGGKTNGNPFVSHAFLIALEETDCATGDTGWYPQHLVLKDTHNQVAGVAPTYVKTHSRGEYVFDYGWADAFERAGGRYYPKLQVSVPFTPATGPRLLCHDRGNEAVRKALASGLQHLCRQHDLSSAHITFTSAAEAEALEQLGWMHRTDIQFHWRNSNYGRFDDFLADLSSRKRKNIRKERKAVRDAGFTFEWLRGSEITQARWDWFFACYQDTGARKWGSPYLTRPFFSQIGETMADRLLLIVARKDGRDVASALNFMGLDTLYGRYWGTLEDHPFLHFETCYYQAMDFAIEHGIKTVEAGAQGPHKLARGYGPVTTHSAHFITNPSFADAIARYLAHERDAVKDDADALAAQAPFRKG